MPDALADLDFRNWFSKRTDVQSVIRESNYTNWFSDGMVGKQMQTLYSKLQSAKNEEQKTSVLVEGEAAMVLYSTLIYYVYPSVPSVKKEIDNKPELKQNFDRMKGWFDNNGGSKIADDFYKELVDRMNERRSG